MVVLHQYDYLLAIGTIFAFFDAWGIGKLACPLATPLMAWR